MKSIVIDLDGTLTIDEPGMPYADRKPRRDVVAKLKSLHEKGYRVVINTARNMKTYSGNLGIINVKTLPTIIKWLDQHKIPYDEIVVGKPWCGFDGFYVDDKAIRPDEFASLELESILRLVGASEQE